MTVATMPGINVKTSGVHHISLRSTDLARSRAFYAELLGFPVILEAPEMFIFLAGSTAISIRAPADQTPRSDTFNPFRVGLDHIALACGEKAELRRVADALTAAGVENTGVKLDPTLKKDYLAFKDPDRMQWELYMAE
jgi:catechol 2,3-dioxygenase-like lactoylglutathione lyase family enzyme